MNYYNEFDKKTAAILRELIHEGLISKGEVDDRSIGDVTAKDVQGYTQCHWFAGIGGWSYALRLAGWSDDDPCDTCSCPCQPFSAAGTNKGTEDARDLWPVYFGIARQRRAPITFGEQVENAIKKHGWLDRIYADMEGCGYAVGASVLPAASVGAPHIRHRLFWVAYSRDARSIQAGTGDEGKGRTAFKSPGCGGDGRLAISGGRERQWRRDAQQSETGLPFHAPDRSCVVGLGDGESRGLGADRSTSGKSGHAEQSGESRGLGNGIDTRLEGHAGNVGDGRESGRHAAVAAGSTAETGPTLRLSATGAELSGLAPAWNECGDGKNHFVLCRDTTPDGAARIRRVPSESAFFPLVDGVQAERVVSLRGAGNAIVPELAAQFIQACRESLTGI